MNRTSARRLQLASQTLRVLNLGSLRHVAGGTSLTYVTPETQAKGHCDQAETNPVIQDTGGSPPAGG